MRVSRYRMVAVCLACALACGCASASVQEREGLSSPAEAAETAREPEPTCSINVAPAVGERLLESVGESYEACFGAWFKSYVGSRKVELSYEQRESRSYGPWEAAEDRLAEDAAEDGSLTLWNDDYYITHDWSQIGQCILGFVPGDVVEVNGRRVVIEGICNYPKDGYYDEVRVIAGDGAVVFQTCVPDSDYNRIAYGR